MIEQVTNPTHAYLVERLSYNPFVIPFCIGFVFMIVYLLVGLIRLIRELPYEDRGKLWKGLFSVKILKTIKESFLECLIHVKIWKKDKLLGFMHSSIAFGWFMMIVIAHIEVKLYCPTRWNLPYYPLFFRYFVEQQGEVTLRGGLLFFLMDLFLLIVLIGVGLAIYKRFHKKKFGMRRTTSLPFLDQVAVYTLWAIFPLRLIAESFTSNISGGSFLTRGFGLVFDSFINNPEQSSLPFWWAYSTALGMFLIAMPFSRFMHILTEPLYILMKNSGIKLRSKRNGYAKAQIYSCSKCGVCIDPCQMITDGKLTSKYGTVYFMQFLRRENEKKMRQLSDMCMMCGRCEKACPVAIESCGLKLNAKTDNVFFKDGQYGYIDKQDIANGEYLYFAGCMTHQTPTIKKAMVSLFDKAGIKFSFMDQNGSICCGRPLRLAGQEKAAQELVLKNKQLIEQSGAKALVTSCPICYKIFNEEYNLSIPVLHHTQFINQLVESGKLKTVISKQSVVYHDPCELGRNSGIYEEPRNLISRVAVLKSVENEKNSALCCGNSIANAKLSLERRQKITNAAIQQLTVNNPDFLITACPLCKKTFSETNKIKTIDISELIDSNTII